MAKAKGSKKVAGSMQGKSSKVKVSGRMPKSSY
jgi:hypothetical protein